MAHYTANSSKNTSISRTYLLAPPLILTSVFCFVFILTQPHKASSTTASKKPTPIFSDRLSPTLATKSYGPVAELSTETSSTTATGNLDSTSSPQGASTPTTPLQAPSSIDNGHHSPSSGLNLLNALDEALSNQRESNKGSHSHND